MDPCNRTPDDKPHPPREGLQAHAMEVKTLQGGRHHLHDALHMGGRFVLEMGQGRSA